MDQLLVGQVRQDLIDLAVPAENEVWLVLEIMRKEGVISYEELLRASRPIAGVRVLDILQAAERQGLVRSKTTDQMWIEWIWKEEGN